MTIAFRELRKNDQQMLAAFLSRLSKKTDENWTNHFGKGSIWEIASKILHAQDHKIYVGILQPPHLYKGDIVAVGHLHAFLADTISSNCYLGMAVRDDMQNQGVGTQLLKYLIEQARGLGITSLHVHVYIDNKIADHLYSKAGFLAVGMCIKDSDGRRPREHKILELNVPRGT